MSKYVPPHLRNKQPEIGSNINIIEQPKPIIQQPQKSNDKLSLAQILQLPCPNRCSEWIKPNESTCLHHKFNQYQSTLEIATYFSKDPIFLPYLQCKKQTGLGHPMINKCFRKKSKTEKDLDQKHKFRYSSVRDSVGELYNRFLRYAADIDNKTGYINDAAKCTEDFWFLDLGFAPGGMVALLLDSGMHVKGLGVNLSPDKGGNVYPLFLDDINIGQTFRQAYESSLKNSEQDFSGDIRNSKAKITTGPKRFKSIEMDVIQLSRLKISPISEFLQENLLNLSIIGITTSGSTQEDQMDELVLKNLLHFAQLLLTLKYLKPGGKCLVRLHLGLRLVDLHILTLLLDLFTDFTIGKPLTEFAMRKTVWLYCDGYLGSSTDIAQKAIDRLEILVGSDNDGWNTVGNEFQIGPYSESGKFLPNGDPILINPILVTYSIKDIFDKYGDKILNLLGPMWKQQFDVLQFVIEGRMDRVCYKCRKGKRNCKRCIGAPSVILEAVENVNLKLERTNENLYLYYSE